MDLSKPLNSSLPRQQITLVEKLKGEDKFGISDWMKDTMDALESIGRYQFYTNLALRVNYAVVSKEFRLADYYDISGEYDISSAITQEFNVPGYLKHYDITGKAVNLLIGEYLKRPDVFSVRASDAESINERTQLKTDLVHTYLQESINQRITSKLQEQGLDPNRTEFKNEQEAEQYKAAIQEKYEELTPESIEKYMRYDFRSSAEHWANAVLSNDRERFNFRELEKTEFSDMLIADRCFSHIYLTPTGYGVENWNPINVFFDMSPEITKAEEGYYAGRIFYMSKAQVIDRFGWRMQEEQIKQLYPEKNKDKHSGSVYGEFFNATMFPFPAYRDYSNVITSLGYDPWNNQPVGNLPILQYGDQSYNGFPSFQFATGDIVQVTEVYWRSQRRLGKLVYQEGDGTVSTQIVDDTFDPELFGIKELKHTSFQEADKEQEPNTIVWTWVTHIWQGCKVNTNFSQSVEDRDRNAIYFDIKPCQFQFKGDFSVFHPKLPVIGGIFNNRNGKSNSLVDLIKPYQIAYNAFMNLAYGVAQRNNGKMALLDVKLLSNFKDWGGEEALDKAITIGRELGFIPLDTSLSNTGGQVQFNQTSVLDLDESEKIERLIKLAIIFEDQGFKQVGITPQRQGQTQASETATGVQQAINNSYAITETYFENFYNYKRRKLKAILDVAQYCASNQGDITLSYITSDLGEAFIKVNGTELMLRDIGVNVGNSQETIMGLEMARRLALENNTTNLPMSTLVKMIGLKSVADITKALEDAEAKRMEEVQRQREHEQQLQQQQLQAVAEDKEKDRQLKKYEIDTEANVELEKVTLQGIANEGSFNDNLDLTDKLIAQKDIAIKERQAESQVYMMQQQLVNQKLESFRKTRLEKQKQEHDRKLKETEFKSKQRIEDQKLSQIESQNKNQEKLARDKHISDILLQKERHKNEMALKEKEIEMKELDFEIAKLKAENSKKKIDMEIKAKKERVKLEREMGETKAEAIVAITDAKVEESQKLTKIKTKEAEQQARLKMEQNKQEHEFKMKESAENHKLKLKIDAQKAKAALKEAKKGAKKPTK